MWYSLLFYTQRYMFIEAYWAPIHDGIMMANTCPMVIHVNVFITMENHHVQWVNALHMAIFNRKLLVPEGKPAFSHAFPMVFLWFSCIYRGKPPRSLPAARWHVVPADSLHPRGARDLFQATWPSLNVKETDPGYDIIYISVHLYAYTHIYIMYMIYVVAQYSHICSLYIRRHTSCYGSRNSALCAGVSGILLWLVTVFPVFL